MASHAKARRGRLSTIDLLPEWADEAKLNAFTALKERKLPQLEILDTFNAELRVAAMANGETDPPQISRSAFNRSALRVSMLGRRLEETREIAAVLAPKFDQAGDNSITLMIAESIKMMISEMLSNSGEIELNGKAAEMMLNLSRALNSAEQAKRISAETRRKIEAELTKLASKKVDTIAAEAGLSGDQVARIRRDVLGVRS
ncbi:MAG: DUF3486 family protein [Legionella sp.]|nr:DUF3486 family protein [Legionella sp.]